MFEPEPTRRSVVTATGVLALGSLTALAGCSGGNGGGGGGEGAGGGGSDGGGSDGGGGGGEGAGDGGGGGGGSDGGGGGSDDGGGSDGGGSSGDGGGAASFDGWMEGVDNYESVADETGSDAVTVAVGAQGNGGNFAFDPPAISVSSGTTVVWEWTGEGAQHNVAAEGGAFESDLSMEAGFTFEHDFAESGTYGYVCTPHRSMGMKGVVVVE